MSQSTRIKIISLLIVGISAIILSRLYFLQVVRGNELTNRGNRQYSVSRRVSFDRGSILFTRKDGSYSSGASIANGFKVYVNPKIISDADILFQKLSNIIPIDSKIFFSKARKTSSTYEEIANRIPLEKSLELKPLESLG